MRYYAGIGARKTPQAILQRMTEAATYLADKKFQLRSGAADGADSAFEAGIPSPDFADIYLPWKGYNNHPSRLHYVSPDALDLASKYHPNWNALSQGVRKLMGRNMYQILGPHLREPAEFVLCWTPQGKITGGTGQALRAAQDYGIAIINFANHDLDAIAVMVNKIIDK